MKLCHCFNNSTGKVLQSLFQVLFPNPQYIGRAQREAKQQICPAVSTPSSSQQLLLLSVSMGLETSLTFLKCSTLLCPIRAITSRVISLPDSPVHSLFGQN